MALHIAVVNPEVHYFFGLQTKIMEGSERDLTMSLKQWLESPETADIVVYDIKFATHGLHHSVLITFSRFKKNEKKRPLKTLRANKGLVLPEVSNNLVS
jgi:hypothetical protein